MRRGLCVASRVLGLFLGCLALVAGAGTVISFFTDKYPLRIQVGAHGVTSATPLGKLVGGVAFVFLAFLTYVSIVWLPAEIRKSGGNRSTE